MKSKPKFKKHPLAVAWEEFRKSQKHAFEASTLGVEHAGYYLSNRLNAAFNAGARAQELIPKEVDGGRMSR